MALAPIFTKAYWSLVVLGGLYFLCLLFLLNGWAQRHALYAHKLNTNWFYDPNNPEKFGYLKNQVRAFNISTPDGEVLYAWHVLPLAKYMSREKELLYESREKRERHEDSVAVKLLSEQSDSRLVINFHGNAGTIAQGWRTDTYRSITSSADNIHLITADYRGFGYSTGTPDERGLITDGISLVNWAMDIGRIPPERIVIAGQSLGTAVAIAVAEHFSVERNIDFKGLVLVAGFSDMPTLTKNYAIAGFIPILSPLRAYPRLQDFFIQRLKDTWDSAARLNRLVRTSKNLNLRLIHAKDDFEIPWTHSTTLFHSAANATISRGLTAKTIDTLKTHEDLDNFGFSNSWTTSEENCKILAHCGKKSIRQDVVYHGGHNRINAYPAVAKTILSLYLES